MSRKTLLSEAVRCALLVGVSAVAGSSFAYAQDTATTAGPKTTLGTVEVTGSRIKRVDMETSSPIFEIDRQAIDRSGALTIGNFLQSIPAIAGAATNPAVNNGGGDGAATVSLRGLGDRRTLILINGRRVVTKDVNSIPMSMVSRVEVLKDGASATYGSDAVGGVVNFILKTNYTGVEATINYGISSRDDGERKGISSTIGWTGDRGNLIMAVNYNDQKEVLASDRDFSAVALTLYAGVVSIGGSSRIPTGRYRIPRSVAPNICPGASAMINVTRRDGTPGTAISDFRCITGSDKFNYQGVGNVELTPQERAGMFISGNFDITEGVSGYIDTFVNKTRSAQQIAPLPFDGRPSADNIVISQFNYYNPFGVDISDSRLRLSRLGNRRYDFSTDTSQFTVGLKGMFGHSTWSWDTNVTYGKISQRSTTTGYLLTSALAPGLGPSMLINGVVTCVGTPGNPATAIPGCTPIDFFGAPPDPSTAAGQATLAALAQISPNSTNAASTWRRGFTANFAGDLFDVSAGTVQAAFGVEYRKERFTFVPDFLARLETVNYTCLISAEACASTTSGELTTKEVYGEILYPILTDRPWAKSLNVTLGTRYSDTYSGSTLNSKIGVEWRPNDELLVRASYAQVFRAPLVDDLFGGVTSSSDGFTDPCNGFTGPANPACAGVPTDGSFGQSDSQLSAYHGGNPTLKPEEGSVFTYGVVYDPDWLPGFSAAVDVWRVSLDKTIDNVGTQNILNKCFASTIASPSPYCALFSRQPGGEILRLFDNKANVGRTETNGVDLGFKYKYDTEGWGNFRASLDATWLDKYDITLIDPITGDLLGVEHNAGTFVSPANGGQGNYSRWRGLGNLSWTLGNWEAQWTTRYVHGFTVGSLEPDGLCASVGSAPGSAACQFRRGAQTYHNVQLGYAYQPWGIKARVGVDNLFDKQPPILYQNNTLNGNTDERTFDTVGRYYWASLTVEFGGAEPVREVEPVLAPAKTCADLDDDSDGVNNCNDKCPNSSGTVGSDGCAVPVPAPEPEPVMEAKPFKN